jgi:hypothetical protein
VNAMESQPDREPEGQPNEQQGPSPGVPEEAEQG